MQNLSRRDFIKSASVAAALGTVVAKGAGQATPAPSPLTLTHTSGPTRLTADFAGKWPRLLASESDIAAVRARLSRLPSAFTRMIPPDDALGIAQDESTFSAFKPNGELAGYEILHAAWLALLHRVTRKPSYLQAARRFLPAILEMRDTSVVIEAGRSNGDLMIGHWLLGVSLYHDWLHDQLSSDEAQGVRTAITAQARAVYHHFNTRHSGWSYEQNHVFIPAAGLGVAGFALSGTEAEADDWISCATTFMRRSGDALCADGLFYEGVSYFNYAFHWHVIFAAVQRRLTGKDWFGGQPFVGVEDFVLHHTLPGGDFAFDFADWGPRKGQPGYEKPWHSVPTRWSVWSLLGLRRFRGPNPTLNASLRQLLGRDYSLQRVGIFHLLWSCEDLLASPAKVETPAPAYHHFTDHDVLVWRENWSDKNATALWLKCGPPEGHRATDLRRERPEWKPNAGHAHPDAGHFTIWSRGRFLAGDTGYTAIKRTRDHNCLLIADDGQFRDGRYHAFDGVDFAVLNDIRLREVSASARGVSATCVLAPAYDSVHTMNSLERRVSLNDASQLFVHDRWTSRAAKELTWLWHTDEKPESLDATRWLIRNGPASMVLIVLTPFASITVEAAMVPAYTGTPDRNPDWRQRGWRIVLTTTPATSGEIVVAGVLNPARPAEVKAAYANGNVSFLL